MYKRLLDKVFVKRFAAILTVAMMFNIFAPIVRVNRNVYADNTIPNRSQTLDITNSIDSANINNTFNEPLDPNNLPQISAFMIFTVPGDGSFSADHPYFIYDLNQILACPVDADGNPSDNGLPVIDLSSFDANSLSGNITFYSNDGTPSQSNYPYFIVQDKESELYGYFIMDLRNVFDEAGNFIDDIRKMEGKFQFSVGLDRNAFADNAATYVLRFSHEITTETNFPVGPQTILNRNLQTTKTISSIDWVRGIITYEIAVTNTGSTDTGAIQLNDSLGWDPQDYIDVSTFNSNPSGAQITGGNHNYTISIPNIASGATQIITYDVSMTKNHDYMNGSQDFYVSNNLTANVPNDTRPLELNPGQTQVTLPDSGHIYYSSISKSGTYDSTSNTIAWTITINNGSHRIDLSNYSLRDILNDDVDQELVPGTLSVTCGSSSASVSTLADLENLGFSWMSDTTAPVEINYTTRVTEEFDLYDETTSAVNSAEIVNPSGTPVAVATAAPVVHVQATSTPSPSPTTDPNATPSPTSEPSPTPIVYFVVDKELVGTPTLSTDNILTSNWLISVEIADSFSGQIVISDNASSNQVFLATNDYRPYYMNGSDKVYIEGCSFDINIYYNNRLNSITIPADVVENYQLAGKTIFVEYTTTAAVTPENYSWGMICIDNTATVNNSASDRVERNVPVVDPNVTTLPTSTPSADDGNFAKKFELYPYNVSTNQISYEIVIGAQWNIPDADVRNWSNIVITDDLGGNTLCGFSSRNDITGDNVYLVAGNAEYRVPVTYNSDGFMVIDFSNAVSIGWGVANPCDQANAQSNYYSIKYTVLVNPNNLPNSEDIVTIRNTAVFSGTPVSSTTPTPLHSTTYVDSVIQVNPVSKSLLTSQDDLNFMPTAAPGATPPSRVNTLEYELIINPAGAHLCADGYTSYQVVDSLPDMLDYVIGSLEVTNTRTGETLTQDSVIDNRVSANQYEFFMRGNDLIIVVHDETPIKITYKTRFINDGSSVWVENTVTIPRPYAAIESSDESREQRHLSTSGAQIGSGASFNIIKIGTDDLDNLLPGAIFEIVEYDLNGNRTGYVFRGQTNSSRALNTLSDFELYSMPAGGDANHRIVVDLVYEVNEVSAPDGYVSSGNSYTVAMLFAKTPGQVRAHFPNVTIISSGDYLSFFNAAESLSPITSPSPSITSTPAPTSTPIPTATSTPIPTNTSTPVPTATSTPIPTATSTPVPTNTSTPIPTNTSTPVPTATSTPIPTATSTPVPTSTSTPVPTSTSTPVPTSTSTPIPTATSTPVPTSTSTPVPTATSTPIPTATSTPVPTATSTPVPTSTSTPVPTATSTPIPTNTSTPVPTSTSTPVPTATSTPVPTATSTPVPTSTSTPVPTATSTPVPTSTSTPVPTSTSTPVPTSTSTPIPTNTSTPVPTATSTPVPTSTSTPVPTSTSTPVPTATSTPVPTSTSTPVPTATSTPVPTVTSTPVPTATSTPVPTATSTPVPTSTSTPIPTATSTPVPTSTSTPVPTATSTPIPTATSTPVPTSTSTPVPTSTSTPVPTSTSTPVPTATSTPVPTATSTPVPTATSTPVPTSTSTPVPTATSTPVPTATSTPVPTATSTPVPTVTNTPVPTNTPAGPTSTPVEPTPAEPTSTPAEPTPAEPTSTPVEPTPSEPTSTPAEPTPAEPTSTPVEPTPAEPTSTPAEPTPAEPTSTPAEPTPAEPTSTPVEPTPAEPTSTPVEPTPAEPTSTPVEPTPVEPTSTPAGPTDTPVPTNTDVPVPTATPVPTSPGGQPVVPPTNTPVPTAVPTATPVPTEPVGTPEPTATPVPTEPVTEVTLDGTPIGPDDYTINPDGSITLTDTITRTLGAGRHTIVVTYGSGVTRTITIVIDEGGRVPVTGESNIVNILASLILATSAALVVTALRLRRKEVY